MLLHKTICYNDEINERIEKRLDDYDFKNGNNFNLFDPRPVQTKQTIFQVHEKRNSNSLTPFFQNDSGKKNDEEWKLNNGLFRDVDKETVLRNQSVLLNHGDDQRVYVPSSKSNLFFPSAISSNDIKSFSREIPNFKKEKNTNNVVGSNTFSNNTRTQLRSNWQLF